MLFNSFEFLWFLPLVFLSYWYLFGQSLRWQNLFVVAASYLFYGWWDWRFLILIAFTSLCSFLSGLWVERLENSPRRRVLVTAANLTVNLVILGFFKYYNFFADSLVTAFASLGVTLHASTLRIVLPVGISFYTFQALSYTIDVQRKSLRATHDPVSFFAYVSFFPQLVAGPIERATHLLPQFERPRTFNHDQAVDGVRQALWGLFKKMVVADNCAAVVNTIFAQDSPSGSTVVLGSVLFAFQIYGDFSGYSDIAVGTARLFGIDLMQNFRTPYFARDIAEFWRRWHISLSTWFRDYLYIPMGGSRRSLARNAFNTLVVFTVSGLWHGANWTFVVWGLYHGLLFLPLLLAGRNRRYVDRAGDDRLLPGWREAVRILGTFLLVVLGWVFFRAQTIGQAFRYLGAVFSPSLLTPPAAITGLWTSVLLAGGMIAVEWIQRGRRHALQIDGQIGSALVRWGIYYAAVLGILWFKTQRTDFIYFQF